MNNKEIEIPNVATINSMDVIIDSIEEDDNTKWLNHFKKINNLNTSNNNVPNKTLNFFNTLFPKKL